jgi:ligand-binding SRPBCC domain-containing protein
MPQLIQKQVLPIDLKTAWAFFATPRNLNEITPPDVHFEITSEVPDQMYPGLMITYCIRPFLGIPFTWWTEISHIQEGQYFIDQQVQGPYKIWHHQHHFESVSEGVLMTDILHYEVGFGLIGKLLDVLFVRQKVKWIFESRRKLLEERFST